MDAASMEKLYCGGLGLCNKWSEPTAKPLMSEVTAAFEEACMNPFFEYCRKNARAMTGTGVTLVSRRVSASFLGLFSGSSGSTWRVIEENDSEIEVLANAKLVRIYDYVKSLYARFINGIISPSIQNLEGFALLSQASVCWENMDICSKLLKKYFGSSIDYLEKAKKSFSSEIEFHMKGSNGQKAAPTDVLNFEDLIANIQRDLFFTDLKEKLKSIIKELIDILRKEDWKNSENSVVRFIDDPRYDYLKSVNKLFLEIDGSEAKNNYTQCIQEPFRESCRQFYKTKFESEWENLEITSTSGRGDEFYMNYCIAALNLERRRADRCLNIISKELIYSDLIELLISLNISKIRSPTLCLKPIFGDLFSIDRFKAGESTDGAIETMELARKCFEIFAEYDKIQGNNDLCTLVGETFSYSIEQILVQYIDDKKDVILEKDKNESFQFLLSFFNIYGIFKRLVDTKIFNKHPTIISKCADVYSKVINDKDKVVLARSFLGKPFFEAVGFFSDLLLNKNFKKDESIVPEQMFMTICDICIYLENKLNLLLTFENNVFFRVAEDCFDLDQERIFIGILTNQFGIANTYRLSQILDGVAVSEKFASEFSACSEGGAIEIYPLNVSLPREFKQKRIEIGVSWNSEICPCFEPLYLEFQKLQRMFTSQVGNLDKCLVPLYTNGTCVLSCKLPGWKGKITTGVLQSYVLTVFNSAYSSHARDADGFITFKQIQELTMFGSNIQNSAVDLTRILKSWVGTKFLLTDNSDWQKVSKAFDPECKFKPNRDYKYKLAKTTIPCIRFGDEKMNEASKSDSNMRIDCAIVRIMKSRGRLNVCELNQEILHQLKEVFKPNQRDLQRRYDHLIELGYLKRDDDQNDIFIYMP